MTNQTIRIRRVGSVTFGLVLVITGALFLLQLFWNGINYALIIRFWPVILILLGIEVLAGSRQKTFETLDQEGRIIEQSKVIYDTPAILLTMAVTFFSMIMAVMDWAVQNSPGAYIHF